MSKEFEKLKQVPLSTDERETLNDILYSTSQSAIKLGFSTKCLTQLLDIVSASFILGVATARNTINKPSMN